ncbi:MAG: DUF2520 domain-containing protein [Thermoleophilia bacterium]|nr:DUF2520 domain-containing protein [Thermoleophilia bacterium]
MNQHTTAPKALTIIGPGRVGNSIAKAAAGAGIEVDLAGRDFGNHDLASKTVLICVPDGSIGEVAEAIAATGELPRLTGHTSGATTLEPLAAAQTGGAFSIHPLQTVPDGESDLSGCPCAIAGSTGDAADLARDLGAGLGMEPFEIDEADRALYHAAASIAANFLVTLEQTASGLLDELGVERSREVLSPLVQRSLDNWRKRGAGALTGPISRGDEATVRQHRSALSESRPDLLGLYDAMAERTRDLARAQTGAAAR